VLDLVHGITSPDAAVRGRSADEVTDVHRALSAADIGLIVHVLVSARERERDPRCQEAQLHALAELAEWHDLPPEPVSRLASLDPTPALDQREYLDLLLSNAGADPQPPADRARRDVTGST
jgi:hypothetical protein